MTKSADQHHGEPGRVLNGRLYWHPCRSQQFPLVYNIFTEPCFEVHLDWWTSPVKDVRAKKQNYGLLNNPGAPRDSHPMGTEVED